MILDNLINSKIEVLHKIRKLTGKSVVFIRGDITDERVLSKLFLSNNIFTVCILRLKSVSESNRGH